MQAYKLKGTIDNAGNLVITEPVKMPPGDVEVIVLQAVPAVEEATVKTPEAPAETPRRRPSKIKAFQGLFEKTQPAPPDFDPEQAKWEYLKEKHNL
jgi:hypothetical protein